MEPNTQNNMGGEQPVAPAQDVNMGMQDAPKNGSVIKVVAGIVVIIIIAVLGYWIFMKGGAPSDELAPEDQALQAELNSLSEIDLEGDLNAIDQEF